MTETVAEILARLEETSPLVLYSALLLVAYGENLVPPVPGDVAIIYAGYLAGIGRLDLFPVIALAAIGGGVGFANMFAVGRRMGPAIRDSRRWRWLPKRHIRRATAWMRRWGMGVILANRFLSGTRSVVALTAGMSNMPAARSLSLAAVGATVWTTLIGLAGFFVGDNWEAVVEGLEIYGNIVLGGLFILFALLGARAGLRRMASSNGVKT